MNPEERSVLIQRALDAATPTMREIAEEAGLKYSVLRAWKAGVRNPQMQHFGTLAAILRRRAQHLQDLATQLETAGGAGE